MKDSIRTIGHENSILELQIDDASSKLNILKSGLLEELKSTLNDAAQANNVKAMLVTSGKEDTFIAGADINEIQGLQGSSEAAEKAGEGQTIMNILDDMPFPTFCLINGACLGGGFELALACDYRIAVDIDKTKIGLPEVNHGIIPGFGGTQRLPRLTGRAAALKIILKAKGVSAKEAYKNGMVDRLVPKGFEKDFSFAFIEKTLNNKKERKKVLKRRKRKSPVFIETIPIVRGLVYTAFKKQVIKKTQGNYPAPLKAIEAVKRGTWTSLKKGLKIERTLFGQLAVTQESKNLITLYFRNEALKKKKHPAEEGLGSIEKRAAVVGAGTMGGAIAWLFTKKDIPVRMKDIAWSMIAKGKEEIQSVYDTLISKKIMEKRVAYLKRNYATGTLDYSGFEDIRFIIEAVLEKIEVKQKVYKELEENAPRDAVIATNTSSLPITKLAENMESPARLIGMHFFNPANRMPLVEIIPGEKTSEETIARTVRMSRTLGKQPVIVGDAPGFLVNRLLMPYLNEAAYTAQEGASIEEIDKEMESFGWPMGPFYLLDVIGIDIAAKVAGILENAFGERMKISPVLNKMMEDKELLGQKSGKGFYLYKGKEKQKVNPEAQKIIAQNKTSGSTKPEAKKIRDRLMAVMINEASLCLEDNVAQSAEDIDMALVLGTGFPPFRGGLLIYADRMGARNIVSILSDYERAGGKRYKATNMLKRMAESSGSFYGE